MPITPEARRRLAEQMEARRLELNLRWQDVAAAAGLSLKTLHSVRTGTAGIAPLTMRAIEIGLRWEQGTVQRILDGEEVVSDQEANSVMNTILAEDKREVAPYVRRVQAALDAAYRRWPDPTAEQIFPGDEDAISQWRVDILPLPVRIELVAVTWLLRDQHEERDRAGRENPGRVKRPA